MIYNTVTDGSAVSYYNISTSFVCKTSLQNTVGGKQKFKIYFMYISDYTIWPDSLQYYRR